MTMNSNPESNPVQQDYHPQVFFWIATYEGGRCLPQFDPETCKEHLWKEVVESKVVKIGWYPITEKMTKMIRGLRVRANPSLSVHELELKPGQRPIIFKTQKIHMATARKCACGAIWQQRDKTPEIKIPISFEWKTFKQAKGKDLLASICPKCKAYNELACPDCGLPRSKYAICPDCDGHLQQKFCKKCKKTHTAFEIRYECAQCGHRFPEDKIRMLNLQIRTSTYILGWQATADGKNIRELYEIDENGVKTKKEEKNA